MTPMPCSAPIHRLPAPGVGRALRTLGLAAAALSLALACGVGADRSERAAAPVQPPAIDAPADRAA